MCDSRTCQCCVTKGAPSWSGKLVLAGLVLLAILVAVKFGAILDAAHRFAHFMGQPVALWQVALYVLVGSLVFGAVLFAVVDKPYRLVLERAQESVLYYREDGLADLWEDRIRDRFLEHEAKAKGTPQSPPRAPAEPASTADLKAGWEEGGKDWWTKL